MGTRNHIPRLNIFNQDKVINVKSPMAGRPETTKRTVLGEIGNKVSTFRDLKAIDKTSLLLIDKKKVTVQKQTLKPTEKVLEKPVEKKHVVNIPVIQKPCVGLVPVNESFSSDLLAVEDIDEKDKDNLGLVSIYSNGIYDYLRSLETKYPISKDYLTGQEIKPKMRSLLIDWLVEVHQQFHLLQETLYLTVAIIDRFLQDFRSIGRKRLQLVGVTAMFIASKYEEIWSPGISDFVYITDSTYSKSEILEMEMLIIKTLDYSLGRPLPLHFLRRYSKVGQALPIHHTMAKYFLEQSLVSFEMCHYRPSLIAAAAMYLSFIIIGNNDQNKDKVVWTKTLAHYSTYSKDDILPVAQEMASIIVRADECKYQAVRKKYVNAKYMKVSVRPELKSSVMIAIATMGNGTGKETV